jgi:hypothetical protein
MKNAAMTAFLLMLALVACNDLAATTQTQTIQQSNTPTIKTHPSQTFDIVALVDSLDFAKFMDIETATGTVQVLEHVLLTHANDIWWRDKGGGKMRYPSRCEAWPISEAPFDKRRLPSEDIYGHLRLDAPWAHVFPLVR